MKKYRYPALRNTYKKLHRQLMSLQLGKRYAILLDELIPVLQDGPNSLGEIYKKLKTKGFSVESTFRVLMWLEEHALLEEDPNALVKILTEAVKTSQPNALVRTLTEAERDFYKLQILLLARLGQHDITNGFIQGLENQAKLKQGIVTIISVGEVGSNLLRALSLCGIGKLFGIYDRNDGVGSTFKLQKEINAINPFVNVTIVQASQIDEPPRLKDIMPDLAVYCSDRFDQEFCIQINRTCLKYKIPLLIYKCQPFEIEMGPLVIPYETACYFCYDLRRKAVLSDDERMITKDENPYGPRLKFPMGIDLLALDVIKFLLHSVEPLTQGHLMKLNLLTGHVEIHPVLKLPRCPACGTHRVKSRRKLWEEW